MFNFDELRFADNGGKSLRSFFFCLFVNELFSLCADIYISCLHNVWGKVELKALFVVVSIVKYVQQLVDRLRLTVKALKDTDSVCLCVPLGVKRGVCT